MNKEFTPYEIALELKQLGFDEPCLGHYQDRDETTLHGAVATSKNVCFFIGETNKGRIIGNSPISNCVLAPTYSQAFKFFREKHDLNSFVYHYGKDGILDIIYFAYNINDNLYASDFRTYEEAETECLKKLIEIVKTYGGNN